MRLRQLERRRRPGRDRRRSGRQSGRNEADHRPAVLPPRRPPLGILHPSAQQRADVEPQGKAGFPGRSIRSWLDPLADHPNDPLAKYVAAYLASSQPGGPKDFGKPRRSGADDSADFFRQLAEFHDLWDRWHDGRAKGGDEVATGPGMPAGPGVHPWGTIAGIGLGIVDGGPPRPSTNSNDFAAVLQCFETRARTGIRRPLRAGAGIVRRRRRHPGPRPLPQALQRDTGSGPCAADRQQFPRGAAPGSGRRAMASDHPRGGQEADRRRGQAVGRVPCPPGTASGRPGAGRGGLRDGRSATRRKASGWR